MSRIRIALTGGIASGKSTVAELLAQRGAVIIDADQLAREAVAPGTTALREIVETFGAGILGLDGALDRAKLATLIFAEESARRELESIVHPAVRKRARTLEAQTAEDAWVVQVIPLLVESGQTSGWDAVVVVDIDPRVQLERLMRRSGLSEAEARNRVRAQASRQSRLEAADYVIDNSGAPHYLKPQVDAVVDLIAAAR